MNDRELLELAAQAYWGNEIDDVCSIEWSEKDQAIAYTHADNQDHNGQDRNFLWNPLTDDGDAFRLAVKLRLDVLFDGFDCPNAYVEVVANEPTDMQPWAAESMKADPYAATRRAIVRAAAAISESKE